MCGEKSWHDFVSSNTRGSPPHVRGKEGLCPCTPSVRGITPACAGKSTFLSRISSIIPDHPRMCGEKEIVLPGCSVFQGSPPHVRGKVIRIGWWTLSSRITPACAGKSLPAVAHGLCCWDHPRMCGEKQTVLPIAGKPVGSPPHVRGKVETLTDFFQNFGITPACAGKRLKRSRSTVPHAAIVSLFPSVCNKPAGSDGSPAGHDALPFLPIENAAPASPTYNLRSL